MFPCRVTLLVKYVVPWPALQIYRQWRIQNSGSTEQKFEILCCSPSACTVSRLRLSMCVRQKFFFFTADTKCWQTRNLGVDVTDWLSHSCVGRQAMNITLKILLRRMILYSQNLKLLTLKKKQHCWSSEVNKLICTYEFYANTRKVR